MVGCENQLLQWLSKENVDGLEYKRWVSFDGSASDFIITQSSLIPFCLGSFKSGESELHLLTNKDQLQESSAGNSELSVYSSLPSFTERTVRRPRA